MSTHQQPPPQPEVPAELWMLWNIEDSGWVISLDALHSGPTFLVAFSEAHAGVAAEHQGREYGITAIPVRVK